MRFSRSVTIVGAFSALAVTAALAPGAGMAWADSPLAPRSSFTMVVNQADGTVAAPTDGESIPNIDSVKSTIRAYYNASGGVANKTSSHYIDQVRRLEHTILTTLPATAPADAAVVFDVDDTLLWNYDFEDGATNFNFDPAVNTTWVTQHLFVKVPGMPQLLRDLVDRGYALYGVTGRGASQENDTIANLDEQGFTLDGTPTGTPMFTNDTMYTKDVANQPWVDCSADGITPACSTVEYKALTRDHIASTDGVDIMLNVGDQWSDLEGGYADDWVKVPNPTYFLASPDLTDAPHSDDVMVPPTTYRMEPDGSSGYTVDSGDAIANIDPLRKMIRAYYNAPAGTADKVSSPYITQLTSLTSTWATQVSDDCSTGYDAYTTAQQDRSDAIHAVHSAQQQVAVHQRQVAKAKQRLRTAHTAASRAKARRHLAQTNARLRASERALARAAAQLRAITVPPVPAAVFDADDTTLWNYDLEDGVLHFVYDPAVAGTWVSGHLFPAVPGMVAVVQAAEAAGCTVFGLTGRPAAQQDDTIANLTEDGYVDGDGAPLFTADHYFTKDVANQPWVDCGSDRACSTIEYKSGTRGHIEDLCFDVVGNFGDQFSDLLGGYADHTYKVPNPTYYLP
ncbi:hypothetical protein BH11ACT8_BH11ACT8_20540 [soil metagenome]